MTSQLLRIGLLQLLASHTDQNENLRIGDKACREAASRGCDVALFPELWNVGFAGAFEHLTPADVRRNAITTNSPFVEHFRNLARELEMAIAISYLQDWEPLPRNVVSLISREGQIAFTYAKVHPCDWNVEGMTTPGSDFLVASLPTSCGPVRFGAMICFDREFPESARLLMLGGAEIILTPNYCHLDQHRLGQFCARAFENAVALAMANYAAPQQNGCSMAVSPIMYDDNGVALDPVVAQAGGEVAIVVADFDIGAIRTYRAGTVWADAYRKPNAYDALTRSSELREFARPDARGRS